MYITDIYVDLPFDITVVPQYYTIHCIVTGQKNPNLTHYYDSNPDIELTTSYCDNQLGYNCIVNSELLYTINYTYDKTLTIEWEAEKISSGAAFTQTSQYGDHMHRCFTEYITSTNNRVSRNAYLITSGECFVFGL